MRKDDTESRRRLIAVARGEEAADVVIEGARVFGAFTREWLEGDVAIAEGRFAGVGDYPGGERIDAGGRFLVTGFIDAHVHLESSKLMVDELARVLVARGNRRRLRSARDRQRPHRPRLRDRLRAGTRRARLDRRP